MKSQRIPLSEIPADTTAQAAQPSQRIPVSQIPQDTARPQEQSQEQQPGFMQQAGGAIARTATGAFNAITGNDAPFKGTPEFHSRFGRSGDPLGASFRTGAGFALSNDEAQRVAILRNNYPDAEFTTDQSLAQERGIDWPQDRVPRVMIRAQPDEEYRFINAPGFSTQDALDVGTGAIAFGPAARVGMTGRTLVGRMMRGGLAAGVTQSALDQGATAFGADRGFDAGRSSAAALMQAGSEPLMALGGAILRTGRNARTSPAALLDAQGADALNRNASMTAVEAAAQAGGRAAGPAAGAPAAAEGARRALADEFGVQLTAGQQTRDPITVGREFRMTRGTYGAGARDEIRPFMQEQTRAVEDAARRFGGPDMPATPDRAALLSQSGAEVRDRLNTAAGHQWQAINDAYDAAGQLDATFSAESVRDVPNFANEWLASRDIYPDDVLTPGTMGALNRLNVLVREMDGQATAQGESVVGVSLNRIEQARRQINNMAGAAANPTDKRAAGEVRRALDAWTDHAIDNALISGDPAALEALQQARGLRRRYAATFSEDTGGMRRNGSRQSDPAGSIIQRIVEDDLTGTQVVNLLIGRSQLGASRGQARAVERLVTQLGPESPEIQAIRHAYIARLMRNLPTTEQPGGFGVRLTADWREAMSGSGAELTRALFTRSERVQMTRFTRLLEELVPPDGSGRTSGTPEGTAALLGDALNNILNRFPVIGPAVRRAVSGGDDAMVSEARAAITPPARPSYGAASAPGRALAGSQGGALPSRFDPQNSQPPR